MFSISFPVLFVLIFLFLHILVLVHLDSQIPCGGVYLTFLCSRSREGRGHEWVKGFQLAYGHFHRTKNNTILWFNMGLDR